MTWVDYARIPVWTGAGALLLIILMLLDSLFTKYSDFQEIKAGNTAVTTRFMMKLLAQAYILAQSIAKSDDMLQALAISVISFAVLLIIEAIIRVIVSKSVGLQLDKGIQEGKINYALFAGALHVAGALIIGSV